MEEAEEIDEEEQQNAYYSRGTAYLDISKINREMSLPGYFLDQAIGDLTAATELDESDAHAWGYLGLAYAMQARGTPCMHGPLLCIQNTA